MKTVVHKHNPLNDKHVCGIYNNYWWVDKSDCCSNDWKRVTCKKCLKLKGRRKKNVD